MSDDLAGQIRRDLWAIRDFYEDASEPPRLSSGVKLPTESSPGEKMKYAPMPSWRSTPPADLDMVWARVKCHQDLLHYARIIQFEVTDINGGLIQTRVDGDDINQLAAFIDTWAAHLVSQTSEGERAAGDFAKHARKLKWLALPDRRDWMPIGDCPVTVADADGNSVACGAKVRAYTERAFIQCPGCGTEDTLAWWMSQIVPEGSDLAHADAVIACVTMRTFRPLTHDQIRQWASRGYVRRHGKDVKGRTLYSTRAVLAWVTDGIEEAA